MLGQYQNFVRADEDSATMVAAVASGFKVCV